MAQLVCMGASLQCSFGAAPSTLSVAPKAQVLTQTPAATIMDHVPFMNIMPFGSCNSTSNPVVAAATAAALGAFTPMPCLPATTAPWVVGAPTVMLGNLPALNNSSKLMCQWGGVIEVKVPGQMTTMVP